MRLLLSLGLLLSLLFLSGYIQVSLGHNITEILAEHPEFSTFNNYLTATHLAGEINRRKTITVLAVSNAGMAPLLAKHLTVYALKNVLSLHVLVDYFGAKNLHQLNGGTAASSSLFQATGTAPGTTGFVNITNHRAGRVSFSAEDVADSAPVNFVKSIEEISYDLAVIEISSVLSSPEAEAPTPAPAQVNLTTLMSKKGCKTFADLLVATGDAEMTFESNVGGGLTVFCPIDRAMKAFMPKFKNLTADGKLSVLLYHGIPVYNSIQMLKSNNGVVNTLATDGTAKNYNFTVQNDGEVVTLKTTVMVATITGTLIDEDPLAVYMIDAVLEPRELFKPEKAKAPAPAPAAEAEAPTKSRKRHHASPPAPAGPEEAPAGDEKAANDENAAGGRACAEPWVAAATAVAVAAVMVA
ncbi:fasciclin-like arabinogalactan protein 2 [Phoenix dactylifera]|uniref:Fasciclin-like arabinogalactan protein 2 n=1 Tax=Phoenix dactylifera TaxID=42345 RepID=A0A8B7CZC6_PHODC|nr:fasciclin-like arabinogalactan protein 2 [Phoenix dactylifera]